MNDKKKNSENNSEESGIDPAQLALIEEELKDVEDPLLALIKQYIQPVAYIAIAIVVLYFGYNYYQGVQQKNLQTSAKLYAELQGAYKTLNTADIEAAERAAAERQFPGSLTTLSGQPAPYPQIAANYQILQDVGNDANKIKEELSKIDFVNTKGKNRFWSELLVLKLSKLLVDTEYQDYAEAKLKELRENSNYFSKYLSE